MKNITLSIVLILSVFHLSAQEPCDYIPLEISDIDPIWTHLMIDTSIIGFVHDVPLNDEWSFYDGMNHLGFDKRVTFVNEDFIYTAVSLRSNQDEFGFLIDKVNIQTGEKEWQISVDPRSDEYSHKILNMRVSNDKFIVEGARKVTEDNDFWNFQSDTSFGYYFRKEYDLATGMIINYTTPMNGDSTAFISRQYVGFNNFFYSDTLIQHITIPFSLEIGMNVVKNVINQDGILEIENDTVIRSNYAHQADEALRTSESFIGKLKQGADGTFLFIHEFIPLSSSELPMEAVMVRYDANFNAIDSIDLTSYLYGDFKSMAIMDYTEDRIVLRGCKQFGSICDPFFYVLDHEYNLLNSVLGQGPNGNVYGRHFVNNSDEFIALEWDYIDDGNSKLLLYHEDQPFMDTVANFVVVEPSWAAGVNYYTQLDNGDWLIKFIHGCWDDGVFNSLFHEVWRVSESDFALMVSTTEAISESQDLKISPNPAGDYIRLDLEQNHTGSITIYDAQGLQVLSLSDRILGGSDIDVSHLSSGIYTLQVSAEGLSRQRRFVKM